MIVAFARTLLTAGAVLLAPITAAHAASLFTFPGPGSAACSYSSDGCFALPDDFTILIFDVGLNESVSRQFEFSFEGGGSAVYELTINPTGSGFDGTFTFGQVDLSVPMLVNDIVLLPATTQVLGSGPLVLQMLDGILYGITVVGEFGSGRSNYDITLSAVPIPPALLLFGSALVGLGYLARRRGRSIGPGLPA